MKNKTKSAWYIPRLLFSEVVKTFRMIVAAGMGLVITNRFLHWDKAVSSEYANNPLIWAIVFTAIVMFIIIVEEIIKPVD